MQLGQFSMFIYMLFTATFGSVSSTYTNSHINVTFGSFIYALYSLLGLSPAHILISVIF